MENAFMFMERQRIITEILHNGVVKTNPILNGNNKVPEVVTITSSTKIPTNVFMFIGHQMTMARTSVNGVAWINQMYSGHLFLSSKQTFVVASGAKQSRYASKESEDL